MPYILPLLEREIAQSQPVYENTVRFEVADLVERGIAAVKEIESWVFSNDRCAWFEGASDPVIRNVYRGRLRRLVKLNDRYFTQLFVNRAELGKYR